MDAQSGDGPETLECVLKDIKKENIAPCYLLYGEEEYLIEDAFHKITELIIPPADRALNLYVVDGQQENIDDICLALITAPLLSGRKIVAVKDTQLFQSKKILPGLINKIRDNLESNPSRAAGDFRRFLKLTGWKIEDLHEGGWKRISDEEWQRTVAGDNGEDREKWLPKAVELCAERGPEPAASREDMEGLSRVISAGIPEGSCLVLTAREVDKRKQLFKQIASAGKVLYFPLAKGEKSQKYLLLQKAQELLSLRGKKLTPAAWDAIGKKTGFDLRESMSALEKLITYTGNEPVIDAEAVEEAVGKTKEDTVFDLTAALVEKNLPRSLMNLRKLLEQGIHYLVIMKMLIREVRLLLYAKLLIMSGKLESYSSAMDYNRFQSRVYPSIKALGGNEKRGIGSLSGQHPYVIYRILKSSENFSYGNILKYLEYLADMDLSLRSTGRDPKLMLERFLAEVCLGAPVKPT